MIMIIINNKTSVYRRLVTIRPVAARRRGSSNMTNEDIRYWLQCVDQSPPRPDDDELRDGDSTRLRKRARIEHGTPRTFLPTPAPSTTPSAGHEHTGIDIHAMSSPRKRQRDDGLDDNLEDLDTNAIDATPRPRRTPRRPDWADEDSQGSLSVSSSRASSSISYRSSPTKQYRNAELQDTGFRTASFAVNATRQPASLQALRRELTSISYGDGIFPHGLRDQVCHMTLPSMFHVLYVPCPPCSMPSAMSTANKACDATSSKTHVSQTRPFAVIKTKLKVPSGDALRPSSSTRCWSVPLSVSSTTRASRPGIWKSITHSLHGCFARLTAAVACWITDTGT